MRALDQEQQNVESFADVVREHQAGLRAYVRALGVDDIWVDDLAQEVFLVAFRRQADFRANADYGRWLRGIARHLVANERRKTARRSRLIHEELTDLLTEQAAASEASESDFVLLTAAMNECVEQLAPHSREWLERRYAQGENANSLARQFKMTAEAMRQNLRRIRLAVKGCVEQKLQGAWP
jgi:RNA polymerase sigma-70 factor (ECF subfamily)